MKIQGESDMEAAAIRLENVSFGYHGSQVLREINFSVQKGEHIASLVRAAAVRVRCLN